MASLINASLTRLARVAKENGYSVHVNTDDIIVYATFTKDGDTRVLEFNPHASTDSVLATLAHYAAQCKQLSQLYYAIADSY